MNKFETQHGKVLYCIYTLNQMKLISNERKSKLKDLLITHDERMSNLIDNINEYDENQVHEQLLMMTDNQLLQEPDLSDENYSIKSTRTYQQNKHRPKRLKIPNSNFRIHESDDERHQNKRHSSHIKC